jgi:hypothetical protein
MSSDLYLQITATPERGGPPKSIVVFIPRTSIENRTLLTSGKRGDEFAIARELADPLARNLFTHRASFGSFKVAHVFSSTAPPEILGKSPEFVHNGLKAWVV